MLDPIDYVEHPSDVIAFAARCITDGRRFSLITSIEIEGGSTRNCGSLAAVAEGGQMVGYLSNGCIDRDIQIQALNALENGDARVVRYGQGSKFLDLQLPCGGSLTLLIDPKPNETALLDAHEALKGRVAAQLRFAIPKDADFDKEEITFLYPPKFRLVLAGRGAIFQAVARTAHATGFEVAALSPDQLDLEAIDGLTTNAPIRLTMPGDVKNLEALDSHGAFLTLFHDHDWEEELIAAAINTPARFIGCLGSRQTHRLRLMKLRARGVSEQDILRVQGPIGLVPSLRDAYLVAISALAEVANLRPNEIVAL